MDVNPNTPGVNQQSGARLMIGKMALSQVLLLRRWAQQIRKVKRMRDAALCRLLIKRHLA